MGHKHSVKRRQHRNAEVDQFGRTPLMKAIVSHNYQLALEFIASGVDVNAFDIYGETALYLAVNKSANLQIVEELIKNGANVNITCKYLGRIGYTPLMCAAFEGKLEIVKALIQANANVNATHEYGKTALFEAVDIKNVQLLELLIDNDADVNVSCKYRGINEYTPLMCAVFKGNLEITKTLVQAKANVNATNEYGRTALFEAVYRDNMEIVELLIENKVDVNAPSKYKGINEYTPLMCAASKGNLEIATALIQANANVNASDEYGRTALCEALYQENKEIIELLIKNNADVNVSFQYKGIDKYTPLMCAVCEGNLGITTALIQANAYVNAADEYGRTALFEAIDRENMEIVELLIENKADVNVPGKYKGINEYTPLMCAASKGNLEITTALIQANANVNAANEYGRTAFFEAIDLNNKKIRELLITNKADVNVSCEYNGINNYTPLMCAASKGNIEIATALIQANANVNARNQQGRTALFEAIVVENKKIVEMLIENNADVNVSCQYKGINEYTPLMCAVFKGNLEITTSLVQANVDVNASDELGRTALSKAMYKEDMKIVKLLIENKADVNLSCKYNVIEKDTAFLMYGVSKGNLDITTAVIQGNADVNATDDYGRTALFKAVCQDNKEIVKLLIENKLM